MAKQSVLKKEKKRLLEYYFGMILTPTLLECNKLLSSHAFRNLFCHTAKLL